MNRTSHLGEIRSAFKSVLRKYEGKGHLLGDVSINLRIILKGILKK
jgi:hypothetical protein